MGNKQIDDFLSFIENAVTPYQTVIECERRLIEAGYQRIYMEDIWALKGLGKYYIIPNDTLLIGFSMPRDVFHFGGMKIIATHNDYPTFKIKPSPEMKQENVIKLNTEVYGGPILSTWMDRHLSIAGKVVLKSEQVFKPRSVLIDLKDIILTIPNLAIHMNRKVNDGVELDRQIDMLPVFNILEGDVDGEKQLIQVIAERLKVDVAEILDFDLFLYVAEQGRQIGLKGNLISGPRLDNLAMVYTNLTALINQSNPLAIQMAVCFNHEEIGSVSSAGADSALLSHILERIALSFQITKDQYFRSFHKSFIISADAAHATHPNRPEKCDPTNRVWMNQGITVKYSASKRYSTDSETASVFFQLCEKAGVPYQRFLNRADMIGGMTLGPILGKYIPFPILDVGMPMWAMHSAQEVIGVQDFLDTIKVFETFYHCN